VPGFRKGKAPLAKLLGHIPQNKLVEKTLSGILPQLFSDAIKEHKLKPAVYPKFEVVKADNESDWQIRARTAEIPEIKLGDYKKKISGILRAKTLWTPESAKATNAKPENEKPPVLTREQKEQQALQALVESVDITIPGVILQEEVNSRLSKLLERLENLGLNLESYLASIKKTPDNLRAEYKKQAKDAISVDLLLAKIAEEEKIEIEKAQIDAAIQASSGDKKLADELDTPEKRNLVMTILRKRKALEIITSLA
ncbi:hypothetical protein KKB40_00100, partial [Patescibacteria group bacterium]|nr:hypothetical protein [Patescibacteria group bacterium]